MSLQRKKTECVGSLVLPADMMSREAATTNSTTTQDSITSAVEHFGQDLKRSVNLQKRHTEAYGTLIIDALDEAAPHSPRSSSPGGTGKRFNEPLDEVRSTRINKE